MPLQYPPNAGQIVLCDYKGFVVPEMVKLRPVVVISPRSRAGSFLATVIPLSTTPPPHKQYFHLEITLPSTLVETGKFQPRCWAKCDMVNTVSLSRLDLIKTGKQNGKRIYSHYCIDKETLFFIRKATAKTFGIHIDSPS
jgi:uncharacterized protein YifN (PemK superfamily)